MQVGNDGGKDSFGGIDKAHQNETTLMTTKKSSTATGISKEIPPPPNTWQMKQERKQSTLAMGIASGVTGFLVGGPIVGVVAGFAGAVVVKKKLKKREKKAIEEYQIQLAEMLCPPFESGSFGFGTFRRREEMFFDARQH